MRKKQTTDELKILQERIDFLKDLLCDPKRIAAGDFSRDEIREEIHDIKKFITKTKER